MSLVTLGCGSKCQEGVTRKIKLFHCFENKTLPSFQVLETVQTGRAGVCGLTGTGSIWEKLETVYKFFHSWKATQKVQRYLRTVEM